MQTKIAAIKNIKYERLRNNTKASVPSASLDFPLGGVLGNTKLSNPKAAHQAFEDKQYQSGLPKVLVLKLSQLQQNGFKQITGLIQKSH